MDGSRYLEAITSLEELDRRFPFGQYADGTQLDLVYAYFKSSKYELARLTADRFIRLNPDHPEADYAQYMKGLSSYASNDSMVSRYLPGDETGRDIGGAAMPSTISNNYLNAIQTVNSQRMPHSA